MKTDLLQEDVALRRDEKSYKKLFYQFYPCLIRFSSGILHSNEMAEEVVSDVMLKLWTMEERLLEVQNLKTFLYTAVRNASLNCLEKNAKHRRCQPILADHDNIGCSAHATEAMVLKTELQQCLRLAITQLPGKCRLAYQLVRQEGCTYQEAAAIMGVSENTIDRHLCKALAKIVAALTARYEDVKVFEKKLPVKMGRSSEPPVLPLMPTSNSLAWTGTYSY